jgi:hypothetical protein
MIFRLRRQPQPDAVMAGSIIFQLQLQTAFIKDKLNEKIALTDATVSQQSAGWAIRFTRGDAVRP